MPRSERPDMDGYGVPAGPEGLLPWSWAEARLVANRNYWVVTVDAHRRPHAMPVWGLWSAERFWFASAPSALKVRNIATNPHVVVTTADTVEVVSVEGIASAAHPPPDVAVAWAAKYEADPSRRAELERAFTAGVVIQVVPHKAFGLIETPEEFGPSATRWVWS